MEIPVSLPLDHDGFLRRECPHCTQEFKWHHGPANEEAEQADNPDSYHCPICGEAAGPDSWWTQDQIEHIQQAAMPEALLSIEDELGGIFRRASNKHFSVKQTKSFRTPEAPMPLTETDDMTIIASPCHAYEPVKVPETSTSPFHCLVCGSAFAV